ncbi:hypothetical protein CONPUDRAFT_169153 [Coniophora puteana RWD-64-598 SS2]|uniref:Mid2 domain-containing protein n=1 Tax=Coniophora puteana (strain RWD-64-598) TaxID=741705 RepID=A0A5M3M9W5_CONPW|nr:uncharacterized protein CONPUDRAFT_169153 [Coniophora puteana RWD-64-598 SS2]EIW75913.1 hypothetical protein CONPUDRAFT_169153 [Coniophora puteana RWD-64-598 SS2]
MAPGAPKFLFLRLIFALIVIEEALSQITTNATCATSTKWLFNSKGQSPCLIGAFVMSTCSNGTWSVVSVNTSATDEYPGPTDPSQPYIPCACNTVAYSLFSACGYCQGASYISWQDWITACPVVYKQTFPSQIPSNTAVPQWAFLDVTTTGNWNATAAQAAGDLPENSATSLPSATTSSNPDATMNLSPSSTFQVSPDPTPVSHRGLSVGAIAGIAIGGAAVLTALATAFFIWNRRRAGSRQGVAPSSVDVSHTVSPWYSSDSDPRTPLKYYDPNDPTTFPPSFATLGHLRVGPSAGSPSSDGPTVTSYSSSNDRNSNPTY